VARSPAVLVLVLACGTSSQLPSDKVVARFEGGQLTRGEVEEGAKKLPPPLYAEFQSESGQRELAQSMLDRKLLLQEARRRGIDRREEIRRQVNELEERLILRALFAEEEKAAAPVSDVEAKAWFEAHRAQFDTPERVRIGRVFVAVGSSAGPAEVERARRRIDQLAKRLRSGEPLAKVAAAGDGSERTRGGELGVFARTELAAAGVAEVAFGRARGVVPAPERNQQGFAVHLTLERMRARAAAFETVRQAVIASMQPARSRHVFDSLIGRLRVKSGAHLDVASMN
jgi:peptidyl-prolyl cis-trans isomerase C